MPNAPIIGKQDFQDSNHKLVFSIDPDSSFVQITLKSPAGFTIMEITNTGSLTLMNAARMDGSLGEVLLGGNNKNGKVLLKSAQNKDRVVLDATAGYGAWGGQGGDGGFALFPAAATNLYDWKQATMTINGQTATATVGGAGANGSIVIAKDSGQHSIRLDASTGDISLLNADCAEDFDLAEDEDANIEPGTVVVLDENGRIRTSVEPYDSKVVGVLSGAGGFRPGLVLDHRITKNVRLPVALMGKVFCKADAQYGPIRAGDMLTSSPTPGHAMKMMDRTRALGSVLGKALHPIDTGRGLIPILVTLQ